MITIWEEAKEKGNAWNKSVGMQTLAWDGITSVDKIDHNVVLLSCFPQYAIA